MFEEYVGTLATNYPTYRECIDALYGRFEDMGSEKLKTLYKEVQGEEDEEILNEVLLEMEELVYDETGLFVIFRVQWGDYVVVQEPPEE